MTKLQISSALTIAALATHLLSVSAFAQVTTEDAKCRATIAKNSSKLGATVNKAIDGCIKAVLSGKAAASTNCNNATPGNPASDAKGKISAAVAKLNEAVGGAKSKCLAGVNNAVLTRFPRCPSPANAADDGGSNAAGIDQASDAGFDELSDCQAAINTAGIVPLRNYVLRPRASLLVGANAHPNAKAIIGCANTIAKNTTKLWSTVAKERGKCQTTSDKDGGGYVYGCSAFDGNSKISSAVGKLTDAVVKSCAALTPGELGLVGTCDTSPGGIAACLSNSVKKNASGATATAFEFAGDCPTEVRVGVNAGTGPGSTPTEHLTSTFLDAGWTGFGHDADVVDGFVARVNLNCSNDDCNACTVTTNCEEGNCRCSNNVALECPTPFVTGGPCGTGTCQPHFGPPLALAAGGVATCVTNVILQEIIGTADVGTGKSSTQVRNTAKVHLGINQLTPCPTCSGATIGAGGTCSGGARNGLACTTDAVNPTYGNVSYACPPAASANITGAGLKINLTLTDAAVSLPFGDACDAPLGSLSCACGACTLDNTVACVNDAACSGAGLGTCSSAGGAPRQPNACSNLTCNPDPTGTAEGTCNAGPDDRFCNGAVKGDGEGYIFCSSNADCSPAVGGGQCLIVKQRECYLNPITAAGVAGNDGGELVSTFCSGPTTSSGVNSAGGIPGAGRVRLDFDFTGFCPNGVTQFELGGSNCS